MAIEFARVSIHSRSRGHSAVAGAAYRAGAKLHDERTGETHDYSNRDDVAYQTVLLPESADAIFLDREYLWNTAEAAEKRKDAQVAKDLVLALPKELKLSQQIQLLEGFVQQHFVDHGLIADINIHDHGEGNPHAHVYLTLRRAMGTTLSPRKARDLNPQFANSAKGTGFLREEDAWRLRWREHQNTFFKQLGLELRVDENFAISQQHEGRLRNKNEEHYVAVNNELQRQHCESLILDHPEKALAKLAARRPVFDERDIARFIHKNLSKPELFQPAYWRLCGNKQLVVLGPGKDGRLRYTLPHIFQQESRMGEQAKALQVRERHPIRESQLSRIATRLGLSEEQTQSLRHITQANDLSVLVGRAGTGKSYLMKAAAELWQQQGYNVIGMALAAKAALGLQQSSDINACTIASLRRQLDWGTRTLSPNDVLVMDEAGMTGLDDLASVVNAAQKAGSKLVLLGDPNQLLPISGGAPFRAISDMVGYTELTQVRRQRNPHDAEATRNLSQGDVHTALSYYHTLDQIHVAEDSDNAIQSLIKQWQHTTGEKLILSHSNQSVAELNHAARAAKLAHNELQGASLSLMTDKGTRDFAVGERIVCLENNKTLGVFNGDQATIKAIHGNVLTLSLDRDPNNTHKLDTQHYNAIEYGYAVTIHKAQGMSVDNSFVFVDHAGWDRHLSYVALSRHRDSVHIHTHNAVAKSVDTLSRRMSRSATQDSVLDWPTQFAKRRDINPDSLLNTSKRHLQELKAQAQTRWRRWANPEVQAQHEAHQQQQANTLEVNQASTLVQQYLETHRTLGKTWKQHLNNENTRINYKPALDALHKQRTLIAQQILKEPSRYEQSLSTTKLSLQDLEKVIVYKRRQPKTQEREP